MPCSTVFVRFLQGRWVVGDRSGYETVTNLPVVGSIWKLVQLKEEKLPHVLCDLQGGYIPRVLLAWCHWLPVKYRGNIAEQTCHGTERLEIRRFDAVSASG